MDRYIKNQIDEEYFLRIKGLILLDSYIDFDYNLYLSLIHYDEQDNSIYYDNFDLKFENQFLLKIEAENLVENFGILGVFEKMIEERNPATLKFNKKGFVDILFNTGEGEEGWFIESDFKLKSVSIYSDLSLPKIEYVDFKNYSLYKNCVTLATELKNIEISDDELFNLKYERIIKLISLSVSTFIPNIIQYIKGDYIERPDLSQMKKMFGEKMDRAIIIAEDLVRKLELIKEQETQNS